DLVKLLHHAGCSTEAEYLLRANLLVASEDEQFLLEEKNRVALHIELFGTAKQEEFAATIAAFSKQFSAKLTKEAGGTFCKGFHTVPRSASLTKYRMRDEQCYVRFDYESRAFEAQLESLRPEAEQLLFFRWEKGEWQIIGTGYNTVVVGSE